VCQIRKSPALKDGAAICRAQHRRFLLTSSSAPND